MSKHIKASHAIRLCFGGHVIPLEANKPTEIADGLLEEALQQPGVVACTKDGKEIKPKEDKPKAS